MLEIGTCPRCKLAISEERKKSSIVICNHCGFSASKHEHLVNDSINRKTMQYMVGISLAIVLSFVQLVHWDNHSLTIIPLTIKETIGAMELKDHEQKAEICMELKKWDCVESEYIKAAKFNAELLKRAGDFQMKRAKYNEAAQTYYAFFKANLQNLEVSYNYAKALAKLGQVDEATKYFDQVLAAKPETLQVTVVQNYVKLLVEHKRFDQARLLIEKVRKDGGDTAGSFMESELKQITTASRD